MSLLSTAVGHSLVCVPLTPPLQFLLHIQLEGPSSAGQPTSEASIPAAILQALPHLSHLGLTHPCYNAKQIYLHVQQWD